MAFTITHALIIIGCLAIIAVSVYLYFGSSSQCNSQTVSSKQEQKNNGYSCNGTNSGSDLSLISDMISSVSGISDDIECFEDNCQGDACKIDIPEFKKKMITKNSIYKKTKTGIVKTKPEKKVSFADDVRGNGNTMIDGQFKQIGNFESFETSNFEPSDATEGKNFAKFMPSQGKKFNRYDANELLPQEKLDDMWEVLDNVASNNKNLISINASREFGISTTANKRNGNRDIRGTIPNPKNPNLSPWNMSALEPDIYARGLCDSKF